jgi:hypothetical protein
MVKEQINKNHSHVVFRGGSLAEKYTLNMYSSCQYFSSRKHTLKKRKKETNEEKVSTAQKTDQRSICRKTKTSVSQCKKSSNPDFLLEVRMTLCFANAACLCSDFVDHLAC